MPATLAESLVEAPRLYAPAEARSRLAELLETSSAAGLKRALERGRARDVLLGLADHSPYLWALVQEDPARLVRLFESARAEFAKDKDGAGKTEFVADAIELDHVIEPLRL